MVRDKSTEYLKKYLHTQINSIQRQVLNISEMLVPNEKWPSYRSRILDITNNIRRKIEVEVEDNYKIKYDPSTVYEDIIEVHPPKQEHINYRRAGKDGNKE